LSTKNSSLNFNPQFTTVKEKMSRFANGGVFQQVFEFFEQMGSFCQQVLQQILGATVIFKIKIKRWVVRGCN
jgi:hypothetical protein